MEAIIFYILPLSSLGIYFVSVHMYLKMIKKYNFVRWEILGKPSLFNVGINNGSKIMATLIFSNFREWESREISFWGRMSQAALIITILLSVTLTAIAPEGVYS